MAWLSGWAKRIQITIESDQVDAALSNFPVPIYLSAASGISDDDVSCVFDELTSDANRKKIAVTTSDGTTQCYVEIERWDDANEKAWLHVKLPAVSESADTDLYLYYDSSQADNTTYVGDTTDAAAQSVWDSNFVGVWHMGQDPSGGAGAIKDSTSNANHATSQGSMTSGDLVDGQFGKGIEFDGSNDGATTINNFETSGVSSVTVEALHKPLAWTNAWAKIVSVGPWTVHDGLAICRYNQTDYQAVGEYSDNSQSTAIIDNAYHHTVARLQSAAIRLLQDGVEYESKSVPSLTLLSYPVKFAMIGSAQEVMNVIIDEVRLSKTARSTAWLKATYHGLFDSLLEFGAEEILAEITDAATIADVIDALHLAEILTDGAGLGDTIDGYYLRETITDGAGLGDVFEPLHLVDSITDGAGLGDSLAREIEAALAIADGAGLGDSILVYDLRGEIADGVGLGDALARTVEYYPALTDGAGLSDSFVCLNWSEWLAQNSGDAVKRFYFTLTGDGETPAVADIEIPISSFQTRMRQSEPTYLSVVIPDMATYASAVSARSHGQMVIEMAYLLDGVESVREEICRVDLEDIDIYEGARNQSISLSGHATETYATKITALTGASYYNLSGGLRRYRCAMDPYLRPGDTVRVNDEEFTAGYITLSRSVSSETMEVVEAES